VKSGWRATLAEAQGAPLPAGRRSAELLRHGSLELRYYAPRGMDPQAPHDRDELYIVVSGKGSLVRGGERVACGAGDALFVPAKMEHRFEDFSSDFAAWVVFFGPQGGERDNPFS